MNKTTWLWILVTLLLLGLFMQTGNVLKLKRQVKQFSKTAEHPAERPAPAPSQSAFYDPSFQPAQWNNQESPWFHDPVDGGDPFQEMERMERHMHQMMNLVFHNSMSRMMAGVNPGLFAKQSRSFEPDIDLRETDSAYLLKMDLPGMDKNKINVEVSNHHLIISGERKTEKEDQQSGFYRMERSFGSFQKAIPLPDQADSEQVAAEYKEGVLTVTIPKTAAAQKKNETKVAVS